MPRFPTALAGLALALGVAGCGQSHEGSTTTPASVLKSVAKTSPKTCADRGARALPALPAGLRYGPIAKNAQITRYRGQLGGALAARSVERGDVRVANLISLALGDAIRDRSQQLDFFAGLRRSTEAQGAKTRMIAFKPSGAEVVDLRGTFTVAAPGDCHAFSVTARRLTEATAILRSLLDHERM